MRLAAQSPASVENEKMNSDGCGDLAKAYARISELEATLLSNSENTQGVIKEAVQAERDRVLSVLRPFVLSGHTIATDIANTLYGFGQIINQPAPLPADRKERE